MATDHRNAPGPARLHGMQSVTQYATARSNRSALCTTHLSPMNPQDFPLTDLASAQAMFAALQAQAASKGVALRSPPPAPTSCCGRGCNGCVWEGYYEAVVYWRDEALLILAD